MADKVDTPLTPNTDDKITYDKTVAYQEIVLFEYKTKMIIMNTVICVLLANRSPIGMFCLGSLWFAFCTFAFRWKRR